MHLSGKIILSYQTDHIFRVTGKPSIGFVIFEANNKESNPCILFGPRVLSPTQNSRWRVGGVVDFKHNFLRVLNYFSMDRFYKNKITIHLKVKFYICYLIEWISIDIYFVKQPEQESEAC